MAILWNVFDDEPTDECVEEADVDSTPDDERTYAHVYTSRATLKSQAEGEL